MSKKKITPALYLKFQYVSNPRLSFDGRFAAFVAQQADYEGNTYTGDIYVIDNGETKNLTQSGDAKNICWTPDNTILFSALRDEAQKRAVADGVELTAFYELDPQTGKQTPAFTLPMRASRLTWLQDDYYYFVGNVDPNGPKTKEERHALQEKEKIYHTFDEMPFWTDVVGAINGRRDRLYIYNRATAEITPVSGEEEYLFHVATRGSQILYSAHPYEGGIRSQDAGIYFYDFLTGERKTVLKSGGVLKLRNFNQSFCEFWGDKYMIIGADQKTHGRGESPKFWLMDPETGALELFCDYPYGINYRSVGNDSQLGDGQGFKIVDGKAYFTSTVGYCTYVRSLDQDGNVSEFLTPAGCAHSFDIVGDRMIYAGFFGNQLCEIYENGKQLSHLNDALMEEYDVITPEYHGFTASDGWDIDGWIMKPRGYEPGKKYPAIFSIHGGPRSLFGDIYFHEHQCWANDGYFVFFCNPRGSEGRGDEFADVWGKMGDIDYKNLMDFTDEILRAYPDVDAERIGVTGGSYGGFMTNWVIGHTDRFKVACTQRCITSWISMEYASNTGYFWNVNNLHVETLENIDKVWDQSPLKYAGNIKTPTLVIQGDMDYGCTISEGIQIYHACKRAGVDSKLCLFHGEGHELSRSGRPKPRLARMEEILGWMNKYCKA